MGRGDVKTKKGKIWRGSFGNSRPQRTAKKATEAVAASTEAKPKKAAAAKKA
ncbi:MAG TPA: 30S ribosomal protein THX [Cytophagales bacterium]|nr:30S ribosomal protein THX [Cytophagales bacterium]